MGELILDGAGHFFELQNLLLRTWFLGIFCLFWIIQKLQNKIPWPRLSRPIMINLVILGFVIVWSAINGLLHDHATTNIIQDTLLFCFLFLIFPALEYYKDTQKPFILLIKAWIIGSSLFSSVTFFIYSSGLGFLPDTYYHWFRNIAAGKITDLGNNFFRVVAPEHVFIVPIILILVACLIHDAKNKKLWGLLICSLFILVINFSRIYFLGLAAGLLLLAIKNPLKQWLKVSTVTIIAMLIIFSSTYFLASRGTSFGLEVVGLRATGTTQLSSDPSGAIRLKILPDALRQIKEHPWFGSGFGATINYPDPVTKNNVTRTQFDWGYLEMLAELGIVGTFVFFCFFFTVIYSLAKRVYSKKDAVDNPLFQGLLAGALSLFVITITTPALFHGFGILYIVVMITVPYSLDSRRKDPGDRDYE